MGATISVIPDVWLNLVMIVDERLVTDVPVQRSKNEGALVNRKKEKDSRKTVMAPAGCVV